MKQSISLIITVLFLFGIQNVHAQAYKNALGIGIDLGNGSTLAGPQYKHSMDGKNALNAQVLFGDNLTAIGVDYSYNQPITGASGLWWYVGVGPQITFHDKVDKTYFAIRPALGIEYKIPTVPLGFHFDWKPWWNLSEHTDFEAGRFSLGFKFILN